MAYNIPAPGAEGKGKMKDTNNITAVEQHLILDLLENPIEVTGDIKMTSLAPTCRMYPFPGIETWFDFSLSEVWPPLWRRLLQRWLLGWKWVKI